VPKDGLSVGETHHLSRKLFARLSRAQRILQNSHQLQRLETRMPVLADDEMVVHGNPERTRDLDDRLGHLDVGARRRGIAGRMIVEDQSLPTSTLILFDFLRHNGSQGTCIGGYWLSLPGKSLCIIVRTGQLLSEHDNLRCLPYPMRSAPQ
jgi:hypothetical protein